MIKDENDFNKEIIVSYRNFPHDGIQTLQPYIPGKSVEALAKENPHVTQIIKLASNENLLGCSPLVKKALVELSSKKIAAYPAPTQHPIYPTLSKKLNINENQLILGNGSDLLFGLLLTTFALHTGKTMLTHDKAFSTYTIQAQTLGIPYKTTPINDNWEVDINALIEACDEQTALIFLANPNNPTGMLISPNAIKHLLEAIPSSTLLVIDEAYYEYAFDSSHPSSFSLLTHYKNLIITRTFSKAYGLAGLRLGYAMANSEIIELLHRVQLPFVINHAALTAGLAALNDEGFVEKTVHLTKRGMQQVREGLIKLECTLLPSPYVNFVTFFSPLPAVQIYQALLNKGIIVRPLQAYNMNNYLRVTIGTHEENKIFLDKLSEVFLDLST